MYMKNAGKTQGMINRNLSKFLIVPTKKKIDKAKNKISNVQSVAYHSGILPIDSSCL